MHCSRIDMKISFGVFELGRMSPVYAVPGFAVGNKEKVLSSRKLTG